MREQRSPDCASHCRSAISVGGTATCWRSVRCCQCRIRMAGWSPLNRCSHSPTPGVVKRYSCRDAANIAVHRGDRGVAQRGGRRVAGVGSGHACRGSGTSCSPLGPGMVTGHHGTWSENQPPPDHWPSSGTGNISTAPCSPASTTCIFTPGSCVRASVRTRRLRIAG